MGTRIIVLSAVALFGVLPPVCAGTYCVPLPSVIGEYLGCFPNGCRKLADVSFGTEFQSIQSVSIRWSGRFEHGYSTEHPHPPDYGEIFPHGGAFYAVLDGQRTGSVDGVDSTFDTDAPFPGNTWLELYTGQARLWINYLESPHSSNVLAHCNAELYSAELVVDGELVPEPSSLLALTAFLAPVTGLAIWRRR